MFKSFFRFGKMLRCFRWSIRRTFGSFNFQHYPKFNSSDEISDYVAANVDEMNHTALIHFLDYISKVPSFQYKDGFGIKTIVSSCLKSIENGDPIRETVIGLSQLVKPGTSVRQELQNAATRIIKMIQKDNIQIPPSTIPDVLVALSKLDQKSTYIANFIREECKKMELYQCIKMNTLLPDLNIHDSKLNWMIWNRILPSMDSLSDNEIVNILLVFASMNSIHSQIVQKCQQRLQQYASRYDTESLITAFEALVTLQLSVPSSIYSELKCRTNSLTFQELMRVLKLFVQCPSFFTKFVNEIVDRIIAQQDSYTIIVQVNLAYTICAYKLRGKSSHYAMLK